MGKKNKKNLGGGGSSSSGSGAGAGTGGTNTNGGGVKENTKKLSMTKRNELNGLVNNLLKLGFMQSANAAEQWNAFNEIYRIIEQIRKIENEVSVMRRTTKRAAGIEEFQHWMKENGAEFDGVKIAEFSGFEMGLEATKDFKENDLFITIPDKLVMAFDKADESVKSAAKIVSLIASMPNIGLAFYLMLERLKPNSFWKPYFDVLPDRYSTVMYFTPTDLQELKGNSTIEFLIKKFFA